MMARRITAKTKSQSRSPQRVQPKTQPFIEHLHELRRRLMYVAVSIGAWSAAAYGVQHHIVDLLLRPSHGQQFIQTTPGGGIDFLFRICIYTGIVFSIPVIVYQILKYLEPVVRKGSVQFARYGSISSGILAVGGMAFGYFVGLPAALHFLLHQFLTKQIETLISIQSYMSFVIMYMFGSALLFQIPLIILFINRIKHIRPRQLLKFERWFVLLSFIMAGLLDPSPHIMDQLLLAGPMIGMYQISILLILVVNRPKHGKKVQTLFESDKTAQAERLARSTQLKPLPAQTIPTAVAKSAQLLKPSIQQSNSSSSLRPQSVTPQVARKVVPLARRPVVQRQSAYLNEFVQLSNSRAQNTFRELA